MLAAAVVLGGFSNGSAQVTGMPAFDAPYRAFARHEFGGSASFPSGGGTALEGQYRFGYQNFDVGFRGGIFDPGGPGKSQALLGVSARDRVVTHSEAFPLDGAVTLGLGANLVSGANRLLIPVGLSLGRRIDVKDSPVSIVPYGEPVLFVISGAGQTDIKFAMGLGGDFRLSKLFDARVSIGLGDIEGISISAVWVH
jgi:hypothetical protein